MKVHDFSYLLRIGELVKGLKGSDNKVLKFIDGQDTAISEKTWEAALLACGATISAIDAVVQ
jgi:acetoin utilization deacetylase AcuC-like enzyme